MGTNTSEETKSDDDIDFEYKEEYASMLNKQYDNTLPQMQQVAFYDMNQNQSNDDIKLELEDDGKQVLYILCHSTLLLHKYNINTL